VVWSWRNALHGLSSMYTLHAIYKINRIALHQGEGSDDVVLDVDVGIVSVVLRVLRTVRSSLRLSLAPSRFIADDTSALPPFLLLDTQF